MDAADLVFGAAAALAGTATHTIIHPTGTGTGVPIPPPTHTPHPYPLPGPRPDIAFLHATAAAHIASWVFFGVFAAGLVGVVFLAFRIERRAWVFHALSALILSITTLAYFSVATGVSVRGGWHGPRHRHVPPHGPHPDHPKHPGHGDHGGKDGDGPAYAWMMAKHTALIFRQTITAPDFAHIFTTPLLVAQLAVLSGMSPFTGSVAMIASLMSIISANVASHLPGHHKFRPRGEFIAWAVFAALWTIVMFALLFVPGVGAAKHRRRKTQGLYYLLTVLLFVTFLAYAVFWILGTGLNILSVDAQFIALSIVDVSAQLGFIYFLVLNHVHDETDDTWVFPEWFITARSVNPDGLGEYAPVGRE